MILIIILNKTFRYEVIIVNICFGHFTQNIYLQLIMIKLLNK